MIEPQLISLRGRNLSKNEYLTPVDKAYQNLARAILTCALTTYSPQNRGKFLRSKWCHLLCAMVGVDPDFLRRLDYSKVRKREYWTA